MISVFVYGAAEKILLYLYSRVSSILVMYCNAIPMRKSGSVKSKLERAELCRCADHAEIKYRAIINMNVALYKGADRFVISRSELIAV